MSFWRHFEKIKSEQENQVFFLFDIIPDEESPILNPMEIGLYIGIPSSLLLVILGVSGILIQRLRSKVKKLTKEQVDAFLHGNKNADENLNEPNASVMAKPYDESLEIPRDSITLCEHHIYFTFLVQITYY